MGDRTILLVEIATELDARYRSNNCVIPDFECWSWDELCDKAIEILNEMKERY